MGDSRMWTLCWQLWISGQALVLQLQDSGTHSQLVSLAFPSTHSRQHQMHTLALRTVLGVPLTGMCVSTGTGSVSLWVLLRTFSLICLCPWSTLSRSRSLAFRSETCCSSSSISFRSFSILSGTLTLF